MTLPTELLPLFRIRFSTADKQSQNFGLGGRSSLEPASDKPSSVPFSSASVDFGGQPSLKLRLASRSFSEGWWRGEDSNLRSPEGRWVYSPVPLTARPPLRNSKAWELSARLWSSAQVESGEITDEPESTQLIAPIDPPQPRPAIPISITALRPSTLELARGFEPPTR